MTSNLVKKLIATGVVGSALLFGNPDKAYAPNLDVVSSQRLEKSQLWNKAINDQNADDIKVPSISTPNKYCARYAVLSAEELFGKKYVGGNAWDMKYDNFVPYNFDKEKEVRDRIIEGELSPGMLVLSKWPVRDIKTYGNRGFDKKGNPIEATHVVEYIGIGKETAEDTLNLPEPIFLHQWGNKKEKRTQKQLWDKYNLEFVSAIDDRELTK